MFNRRRLLAAAAALPCVAIAGEASAAWSLGRPSARQRMVETAIPDAAIFEGEAPATRTIAELLAEAKVAAVSFALIDKGRIAWAGGYGVGSKGGPPVTPDTLFQAGSIAKPVAAIGALRMRDRGQLDLDRDAQVYLGDYRIPPGKQSAANPVTLRNLISHTSGITPGGYQGYPVGAQIPTNEQSARGNAPANSPTLEVVAEPGSILGYSGGGYTLLEIAMQNVSGRPFEALMRDLVLDPVGMRASTFEQPPPASFAERAATGFRFDGEALPGGWMIHPEQAAAGLWSTPSDIARFIIEVRNAYLGRGRVIPTRTARDFLTVQTEDEGLGIIVHGAGPTLEFRHGGGTRGFSCYMIMENVEKGRGAVFMTNSDNGQAVGVPLFRAAAQAYGWTKFQPVSYRRVVLPAEALHPLAGSYSFGPVAVGVTYEEAANRIVATFPNGDAYPMVPVGPRKFVHPADNKVIEFEGEAGKEVMLVDDERGTRVP